LVEGAVLLALGIYTLTATDSARETVFAVFGILLTVNGVAGALRAVTDPPNESTGYHALRAGIALSTGVLALIARFTDLIDAGGARLILAVGFIAVGLIGVATLFFGRREARFPLANLAWQAAFIILGLAVLTGSETDDTRFKTFGWITIVAGGLLIALAFYLRRSATDQTQPSLPSGSDSSSEVESSPLVTPASDVAETTSSSATSDLGTGA